MGIGYDTSADWTGDWHAALAALAWQHDLGATEAVTDSPINRYDTADGPRPQSATPAALPQVQPRSAPVAVPSAEDPVLIARAMAARATSLDALADIQASYEHCDLRKGARSFVFADGRPGARVMILGEAPGRDEDLQGKPFVGRAGQLLDRMLTAIGLSRSHPDPRHAVYITNILPWRPPGNRDPEPAEIAMMMPFVERHIALAAPDILVLMGNIPCAALLGQRGITRLRGQWSQAAGLPVLAMFHPAYLLRNPPAKREAWADLLSLQSRLRQT